eukprot:2842065-Rhodomonas_salina.1
MHARGADLNSQNRQGQTALHFAFAFGTPPPKILCFSVGFRPREMEGGVHGAGEVACEQGRGHECEEREWHDVLSRCAMR